MRYLSIGATFGFYRLGRGAYISRITTSGAWKESSGMNHPDCTNGEPSAE